MDGLKMQQESNNNRIPSLVTECILLLLIVAFAFWVNRDPRPVHGRPLYVVLLR